MRTIIVVLAALSSTAYAETQDDGYCDYVEGVANAQAAIQMSPSLIGTVGYVEQPDQAIDGGVNKGLRLIAGVQYRLSGLYEGAASARDVVSPRTCSNAR